MVLRFFRLGTLGVSSNLPNSSPQRDWRYKVDQILQAVNSYHGPVKVSECANLAELNFGNPSQPQPRLMAATICLEDINALVALASTIPRRQNPILSRHDSGVHEDRLNVILDAIASIYMCSRAA